MLGGTSKAGHSGLRGTPPSLTCTGRYPCERSECLRRQRLCGHSVAEIDSCLRRSDDIKGRGGIHMSAAHAFSAAIKFTLCCWDGPPASEGAVSEFRRVDDNKTRHQTSYLRRQVSI